MTEVSLSATPPPTEALKTPGRRYSLTVCSRPKLVWFRNAKAGTRTLYKLLKDASVDFETEHEFNVPFDAERYRAHYKFAVVRNPWDRLVSGWRNKIHPERKRFTKLPQTQSDSFRDFGAFVRFIVTLNGDTCDVHFRRQTALISPGDMDHIARFEHYEDEVRGLFATLGLNQPKTIPHENSSHRKKPYQSSYTDDTRSLVGEFYQGDIEAFNYAFDDE